MRHAHTLVSGMLAAATLAGCGDDPRYLQPAEALEVNAGDMAAASATSQFVLPIRLEEQAELTRRQQREAELGAMVPFVKMDDMTVSIEWTIKNLEEEEGTAFLAVNGANEWFAYVPGLFVPEGEEDDVAPPPPLMGGIPLVVGPGETRSGTVREGAVREAAIDIELITRAGEIAGAAVLRVDEDTTELVDVASGATVPADAFAGMIRFDIVFSADRHMVLEYAVRVRDHRGLLHDELLAADPAELTAFAPADFTPAPPAE